VGLTQKTEEPKINSKWGGYENNGGKEKKNRGRGWSKKTGELSRQNRKNNKNKRRNEKGDVWLS